METTIKPNKSMVKQSVLKAIMSDIDNQPGWRTNANKACAYYDGDQLTEEVKSKLEERGQPMTIHNLIAPAIDGILGMEAKTRTDLVVMADEADEELEEMAEAINSLFADAARICDLDRARSEAYASMIKSGIGWVEVFRSSDLFASKYKIKRVPRDEVYWDWHSNEADLSDARWLMRIRWIDVDELKQMVPNKADVIDWAVNAWNDFADVAVIEGTDPALVSAWEEYQGYGRKEAEWMNSDRNRVRLQVIYFRKVEKVPVIVLPDDRVIEFDKNNPAHVAAVAVGRVNVVMTNTSSIVESWYAGPHHLGDKKCDSPDGLFPLVPFIAYRKDKTGEPYGLISRAIPAQDEVNFRRIKLTFLLQAKRVVMDQDATTMSRDKVTEEVERPDGLVTLNPDRRNHKTIAETFQVQQDFNIASQQFDVMRDSMQQIQDTMGVYGAFLGQESNASSGVAIANLVEQGATTLAEINDNYRLGCQLVGKLLLGYIIQDMKGKDNFQVTVNREDIGSRKKVMLNEVAENGMRNNDLARMRSHIALAPIQQTTAYKSQLADRMMQVTAQLPPNVQAVVLDLVLELSDVPNKSQYLERVRGALGIEKDPEDLTPEEQQQMQQKQQQEQQQQELMMREATAKVSKLESEASKAQAQAEREMALVSSQGYSDAKMQVETAAIMQKMEETKQDIALKFASIKDKLLNGIESELDNIQL